PAFDLRRLQSSGVLESGYGWYANNQDGAVERNSGTYLHWGCRIACPDTRDPVTLAATQANALELMRNDLDLLRTHGYAIHLAPRIGVRESRRIVGEAVVSLNDLMQGNIPDDSVMVTARGTDIWTDGTVPAVQVKPYGIPYRALVPQDVDGLLVIGKSLSGSHLAMSSYRVQCILGTIGQAGGVAAAIAAHGGMFPRAVDVRLLRRTLTSPPQNVSLEPDIYSNTLASKN
ncbi:MAG TPA: FAD-dependent oxidoreductase, partial [Armatimonadota bacterium]|nr:FAD-dependent oxidoreductase [Armatimonadota bacterium]